MKKRCIDLSKKDEIYLKELLSKGSLPVMVFKRATALLELNRGTLQRDVKPIVGVSITTLSNWSKRYREEGLNFLYDKVRTGRPQTLTGEDRAKITALACSKPPEGYAKWSLRLLANRAVELELIDHISHNEVGKILKKIN